MGTKTTKAAVMGASVRIGRRKDTLAELLWHRCLYKDEVRALRVCTEYAHRSKTFSPSLMFALRTNSMRDRLACLYVKAKVDGAKSDER